MCTLTYVPLSENRFILTVNRDEGKQRPEAHPPRRYSEAGIRVYYPKDGQAEGTWLGISEQRRAIDLLNGGFEAHKWDPPYRMSRGLLVRQALVANNLFSFFKDFEHTGMEPFTLVAIDWQSGERRLFQWVWDGEKAHWDSLAPNAPHIWSSSPLYTATDQLLRQRWWTKFLQEHPQPSPNDLWHFHHNAGVGNPRIDIKMSRPKVQTVSISQLYWAEHWKMRYADIRKEEEQEISITWNS